MEVRIKVKENPKSLLKNKRTQKLELLLTQNEKEGKFSPPNL